LIEIKCLQALITKIFQIFSGQCAQRAGFEDEHYFCRFFKMKMGLTSGQWRTRSLPKHDL
jgi:YesN/AraC family two-component response regulator